MLQFQTFLVLIWSANEICQEVEGEAGRLILSLSLESHDFYKLTSLMSTIFSLSDQPIKFRV